MNAEIIAIGSELLTPFRQDTNSLYLTEKLNQLGVEVIFKTIVGDRPNTSPARPFSLCRAPISPYSWAGSVPPRTTSPGKRWPLPWDSPFAATRKSWPVSSAVSRRDGWKMSANNVKQADVITGAMVLPNPGGTAPGQWISGRYQGQERIILLLPGPPHEMQAVFEEQCLERLRAKLPPRFIATRELKIAGMGESACDARVAPLYKRYTDVQTTILAGAGEIQLHFRTRAASLEAAQ